MMLLCYTLFAWPFAAVYMYGILRASSVFYVECLTATVGHRFVHITLCRNFYRSNVLFRLLLLYYT